jgi:hypothetical protein
MIYFDEDSEWNEITRTLTLRGQNRTFANIIVGKEDSTFTRHPTNPQW